MKNIYLDSKYFSYCLRNGLRDNHFSKIVNSTIASSSVPEPKGKIFINLSSDEIKHEIKTPESAIFKYRHSSQQAKINYKFWLEFTDEHGIINDVKQRDYYSMSKTGISLFILDIDEKEASEIRDNFGCWVISLNELKSKVNFLESKKTIVTDNKLQDIDNPNINGYKYIFRDLINIKPTINSILISDPYIFNRSNSNIPIQNLRSLLDLLLPVSLNDESIFNIAIITNKYKSGVNSYELNFMDTNSNYNTGIRALKDLRSYKINFQLLFLAVTNKNRRRTHKRIVYTTSHKITFDDNTSICIFNENYKPINDEEIKISTLFNDEIDDYDIDNRYLNSIEYLHTNSTDNTIFDIIDRTEYPVLSNPILKNL